MFTLAFIASIPVGNALTTGKALYLPDASAVELRDFYGGSGTAVVAQSALQLLAAFALYRFALGVRAALRPAAGRGRAGTIMAAGTVATAGFLFLSVVLSLVLVVSAESLNDTVLAGLARATLVSGGALHLIGLALFVTASSVVGLRSGARTRWVFHYGRVVGPLLTLSAVSIVWPPLVKPEVLWRLLGIVWIVGVAIAELRGRVGDENETGPAHAGEVQAPAVR